MSTHNQHSGIGANDLSASKFNSNRIITILATSLVLALLAIGYLVVKGVTNYTVYENDGCARVCCDTVRYNAISEGSLDTMICHYRNEEWWKTSGLFSEETTFNLDVWEQRLNDMNARPGFPKTTMYDTSYNARYMDVSLESLDNYLCTIKRNCGDEAMYVRLYYIRYGQECFNPAFANKHSLAMIPVRRDLREIPNAKDCSPGADAKSLIFVSQIANHNEICPPEPPLGCSERLNRLDKKRSTY